MFRKVWIVLQVLALLALLLASSCGAPTAAPTLAPTVAAPEQEEPTAVPTEAVSESPCRVALVLPGSIGDKSFNWQAYEGLQRLKDEFQCEVAYSEMVPRPDYVETIRGYADDGYNYIVTHGFEFQDAVVEIAPQYPDVRFIAMSAHLPGNANYCGFSHKDWEAAYPAGIAAGRMSETGTIGCITGFPGPGFYAMCNGFFMGARSVNPDIKVLFSTPNSFDDIAAGRETALTMIGAGADIIFEVADQAGTGIIQAAEEKGTYVVGFGVDRNVEGPETVLTSTIVDWGGMIVKAFQAVQDPNFDWTQTYEWGPESGYNYLAPFHGLVPDEVAAEATEALEQIASGELKVPYDTNEPTAAPSEPTEPPAAEVGPCKVALVLPGSIGDKSFNWQAYEGLQRLKDEFQCEVAYSEMVPRPDYVETIRGYADDGYNYIVTHGFEFQDAVVEIAPQYPDVRFIAMSAHLPGNANYCGFSHKDWEAAYPAGIVAGRMSETGTIGCITGFPGPGFYAMCNGFFIGARSVNPDIKVLFSTPNSFDDIAAGRETALTMIGAGADIIFEVADQAGTGIIQAAEEKGTYVVGFGVDRNAEGPETVMTSTIVDWGGMIVKAFQAVQDPNFDWTQTYEWGPESGYNYLAPFHGLVPDEVAAEATEALEQIASGELKVPYDTNEP